MDERAMNCLTYGLFVLTARRGEKDNGCIVNTVQQVTAQPNRIGVAVNKLNFTHDMIMDTGVFNVSIISESAEFALFQRFGFSRDGMWTSLTVFRPGRRQKTVCATSRRVSTRILAQRWYRRWIWEPTRCLWRM